MANEIPKATPKAYSEHKPEPVKVEASKRSVQKADTCFRCDKCGLFNKAECYSKDESGKGVCKCVEKSDRAESLKKNIERVKELLNRIEKMDSVAHEMIASHLGKILKKKTKLSPDELTIQKMFEGWKI